MYHGRQNNAKLNFVLYYWVDQKVCSGFSVRCYRKARKNFSANPIQEDNETKKEIAKLTCYVNRYTTLFLSTLYEK